MALVRVKVLQKMNGSALKNKPGFSLIEMLMVLGLIMIISSLVMPSLRRRPDKYERQLFIDRLNGVVAAARHQSMISLMPHRIVFKLGSKGAATWIDQVWIEGPGPLKQKDRDGNWVYERISSRRDTDHMGQQKRFRLRQFKIEDHDELQRYADKPGSSGNQTGEIWFFVVPDGLTQEVQLEVVDSAPMVRVSDKRMVLTLNPFTGRFELAAHAKN